MGHWNVRLNTLCIGFTLLGGSTACMNELDQPITGLSVDEKGETTKELPWGASDDPSIFSGDLKYTLADLPRQGSPEQAPWTGTYWPTYKDSINVKWDGADSVPPSTKYGQAFDVDGIEDAVSRMRGIDGQSHRTECETNGECKEEVGEAQTACVTEVSAKPLKDRKQTYARSTINKYKQEA